MEPAVHRAGDVQEERPQLHPPPGDCHATVPRDSADYDLVVQHQGRKLPCCTAGTHLVSRLYLLAGTWIRNRMDPQ